MSDWIYEERKIVKIFAGSIVVFGEVFLLIIIYRYIYNQFDFGRALDFQNILILTSFLLFWSIFGIYILYNTANLIRLEDKAVTVQWSNKRNSTYSWDDVKIKEIGSSGILAIIIIDRNWSLFNRHWLIPRILFLDGSSANYKELIYRISKFKNAKGKPLL